MHGEQARGRRGAQNFLARGDRARHAGAVGVRLFRCAAHRAEALRHHADEVGMGDVDFRIDHRDRDIGAPDHAVNVQHLELLQDVLRGVALLAGIAPRRRRLVGGRLLQGVDVVRLHDRGHPDIRHRLDRRRRGPAVGDAQAHHDRSRVGEVLRLDDRQSEPATGGLQPFGSDVAGDLHHHLVLDQAGFGERRNIHDPALEAGQNLPSGSGPAAAPAAAAPAVLMAPWMLLTTGGVLSAASCVRAVRFRMICVCWAASDCEELVERSSPRGRRQDAGVDEEAQRVVAVSDDRWKRRRPRRGGRVVRGDERVGRAARAAGGAAGGGGIGDAAGGEARRRRSSRPRS